jgi:lysophospholipase L1-like esterase
LRDIHDALGPRTRKVMSIGLTPVDDATASDPDHVWSNVEIKRLDAIAHAVADERGARRVEIFDAFRSTCSASLLADGIHPNAAGHRWLFQRILPEILDAVGETRRLNAVGA